MWRTSRTAQKSCIVHKREQILHTGARDMKKGEQDVQCSQRTEREREREREREEGDAKEMSDVLSEMSESRLHQQADVQDGVYIKRL